LLREELPALPPAAHYDASDWLVRHGATARNYYEPFLALFVQRAILFETLLLSGDEQIFARDVFLPAFARLERQFGLKPLVVPAEPPEWEGDDFWQLYPQQVREQVGGYRAKERFAVDPGPHWVTPAQREEAGEWPLPMRVANGAGKSVAPQGAEPVASDPAAVASGRGMNR
jgi:hypothetical protein